tara:strand:+ start:628 stop:1305 length:678 start_codon:yes stop_codon:yes gene_type:complete
MLRCVCVELLIRIQLFLLINLINSCLRQLTLTVSQVTQEDRKKILNQKGAVIWLTGLPCSGKTTISTGLQSCLLQNNILVNILDGDQVRKGLSSDLDFSKKDREENIRRIGEVAKLFAEAGFVVIVAFISPFRKSRDHVRDILDPGQFIETYLECSIEECEKRDTKGLYKRARNGEISDFTGVSSPYEPPIKPEIHVKTHIQDKKECINEILDYLIRCGHIPSNT